MEARTRALVVGPYLDAGARRKAELVASAKAPRGRSHEARLSEALGLAQAIGVEIVAGQIAPLSQIRPASYLGKGKVAELAALVSAEEIDLVVWIAPCRRCSSAISNVRLRPRSSIAPD